MSKDQFQFLLWVSLLCPLIALMVDTNEIIVMDKLLLLGIPEKELWALIDGLSLCQVKNMIHYVKKKS